MAAPSSNVFFGGLPADFNNEKVKEVFGAYGVIVSSKFIPGAGKHSAIVQYKTVDEAAWIVENLNGNIPEAMDTPVTVKFANDGAAGGAQAGKGVKGAGAGAGAWGKAAGAGAGGAWGGCGACGKGGAKDPWGVTMPGKGGKDGGCGIKMLVNGLMQAGALPGGKWSNDQNALFVSGLPEDTTDADLYAIFSPFGAIPCRGCKVMCQPDGTCKGFGFVNYVEAAPVQKAMQTLNGTGMPNGKTLSVKVASPDKGKGKGKEDGEGKAKKCKWCEMGECWDHGQIGKPGKDGGK